jgi:hypothetical protein
VTAAEQTIVEIDERLSVFVPQYEGMLDYDRLNIKPETKAVVAISIADYEQRMGLLRAAREALAALMADGHPNIDVREVEAAVLADLKENAATIEAALKQFSSNAAASLAMSSEEPVKK